MHCFEEVIDAGTGRVNTPRVLALGFQQREDGAVWGWDLCHMHPQQNSRETVLNHIVPHSGLHTNVFGVTLSPALVTCHL